MEGGSKIKRSPNPLEKISGAEGGAGMTKMKPHYVSRSLFHLYADIVFLPESVCAFLLIMFTGFQ